MTWVPKVSAVKNHLVLSVFNVADWNRINVHAAIDENGIGRHQFEQSQAGGAQSYGKIFFQMTVDSQSAGQIYSFSHPDILQ